MFAPLACKNSNLTKGAVKLLVTKQNSDQLAIFSHVSHVRSPRNSLFPYFQLPVAFLLCWKLFSGYNQHVQLFAFDCNLLPTV